MFNIHLYQWKLLALSVNMCANVLMELCNSQQATQRLQILLYMPVFRSGSSALLLFWTSVSISSNFWTAHPSCSMRSSYSHTENWIQNAAVVQSLSHVWLFVTPWTAACQASLSFTISLNLLKLMSIESVMPSYLLLCRPLLLLLSIFPTE